MGGLDVIQKKYNPSPHEYRAVHHVLSQRLNRIAFDAYYKCQRCGAHRDLEMHIPNCDPRLIDQPGFFTILCAQCHKEVSGHG